MGFISCITSKIFPPFILMVGFLFCHFADCYRPTVEKQICHTCPELKIHQIICIHSARSSSVCYEPHHIVCLSVCLWDLHKHFKSKDTLDRHEASFPLGLASLCTRENVQKEPQSSKKRHLTSKHLKQLTKNLFKRPLHLESKEQANLGIS